MSLNDPIEPSGPSFEPAPGPGFSTETGSDWSASTSPANPWDAQTAAPASTSPWNVSPVVTPPAYLGGPEGTGYLATPAYPDSLRVGVPRPVMPLARPMIVTLAAVMGFIQAGWCLLMGGLLMVFGGALNEYAP